METTHCVVLLLIVVDINSISCFVIFVDDFPVCLVCGGSRHA